MIKCLNLETTVSQICKLSGCHCSKKDSQQPKLFTMSIIKLQGETDRRVYKNIK